MVWGLIMDFAVCLKALGEPMRLAIFQQLLIRRHCTRSLSMKLGITESAVSQHLKVLRDAGMIYSAKYGYHTHHYPAQEALDYLEESFKQMCQASRALDRNPLVCQCEFRQYKDISTKIEKKDAGVMRIAIPFEDGQVFQHFGRTKQFVIYDVLNEVIQSSHVIGTEGFGHSALAGFLKQHQVDILICGGIGGGAQAALSDQGIRLYAGIHGDVDKAIEQLMAGKLEISENPLCNQSGDPNQGEDHNENCGHDGHCCK